MCVFGWGALETQNGTSFVEVFWLGVPSSIITWQAANWWITVAPRFLGRSWCCERSTFCCSRILTPAFFSVGEKSLIYILMNPLFGSCTSTTFTRSNLQRCCWCVLPYAASPEFIHEEISTIRLGHGRLSQGTAMWEIGTASLIVNLDLAIPCSRSSDGNSNSNSNNNNNNNNNQNNQNKNKKQQQTTANT